MLFYYRSLFIFIALFISNFLFTQTIKGLTVNSKQELIPYATIKVFDENYKVIKTTNSNTKGEFEVILDSNNSKYISGNYLKSKSDTVLISTNKNILVLRGDNITDISEVVITGKPTMVRKADRFVYSPNELLKEGASTLDIMKTAPLIDYDTKSDLFSIINKENTMIIINDRKSVLPKDMLISFLRSTPAKNIIDIEIITNPGSEYSANTTGGIININLKKNIDEGFSGNVVLSDEQSIQNTSILNGSINYRKGKIGLRISPFMNNSFNYKSSDNLIEAQNGIEKLGGDFKRRYSVIGGGFGLDYDINDKNLLSINSFISTVNGKSQQNTSTFYLKNNDSPIDSIFSSPIKGKDTYLYNFGNVYFQHKFDEKGNKKLTANIDYNQFRKENTDNGAFIKTFPANSNNYSEYKNIFPQDFFNISGSVDYSSQVNDKTKNALGVQGSSTSFNNTLSYYDLIQYDSIYYLNNNLSNNYKYSENYLAFYFTKTKTLSEKFNATFGLRVEATDYTSENKTIRYKIDSSYINIFPNLSLAYTMNNKNVLSFSLAKKIKRPAIELLLPGRTYYNPSYFTENNPFLLPVIIYNADAMYSVKNKYYFSFGYSHSKDQYGQFIIPIEEMGNEQQKKTYLNYGNVKSGYFQFYTKQNWFKDFWEMNFSANFNLAYYNSNDNIISGHNLTNFNYNFSINNVFNISREKKWLAFTTIRYNSPIQDFAYRRENVLFKTDLGLKKTFNSFSATLYLSDIFNTYGKSKITYRSNQMQLFNQIIQKSYTRSISLSINYSFGNNRLNTIKNKKSANEELKNRIN